MSDDANKKDESGLAIDWASELETWELDIDGHAEAESSPLASEAPVATPVSVPTPLVPSAVMPDNDAEPTERATATPPPEPLPRPLRPSAETGSLERRMYRPPSAQEAAELERSLQKTMPPPSDAFSDDGPYNDIAPIPLEVLEAISQARPLAATLPPSALGMGETVRPFSAVVPEVQNTIPTPLVGLNDDSDDTTQIDLVMGVREEDGELEEEPTRKSVRPGLELVIESSEQVLVDEPEVETPERAEVRRRITRLEALARRQSEGTEELLLTAAELAESMGDLPRAESLYERALAEAPRRAPALQALIRLAFRHGDMRRYGLLLERLSELPLPRLERTRVLTQLALQRWLIEHDAPAAIGAATEAQRLSPEQIAPNLLLARIEAASLPAKIDATLVPLALRTQDLGLASMWLVTAARAIEVRGELEEARTLYARAAGDDPFAFDAQFSLSRMTHAVGAHAEAAHALLRTLESFDIGPVAEAVRRRAAHMLGVQGEHREAIELLEHASDDVSLRTAAQIALGSGDAALARSAIDAWANGTEGSERALALLTQAESFAEAGDFQRADEALQAAALANPQQSLVRVRREAIARKAGDPARIAALANSEEAGRGALLAAAQLAVSKGDEAAEQRFLGEAATAEAGIAAHLLAIDLAAQRGDDDELRRLLRAESERGEAEQQVTALLALAELERVRGDAEARRVSLEQAAELSPRDPLVLRAYARAGVSAQDAAQMYRREGEQSTGASAAFAHLREGFALPAGSSERLDAFAAAYAASPEWLPATWALHREARRQGDLERLSELHTAEAERAHAPEVRAAHLVRAALIRAGEDTQAAAQQLTRALALVPDDPVLVELVLRLGDVADADVRAGALDRMAAHASPPFRRQLVIAAAGTLEDAGKLDEAAERYRTVLRETPDNPIAEAGLERVTVEAVRGEALLADKRRAVEEASTERTRARALEELLLLEPDPKRALEIAHELFALAPTHPLALRALERDAMERDDRPALLGLMLRALESGRGPRDAAARLRFVQLLGALSPDDAEALEGFDEKILARAEEARSSLWLTRQLTSAAIASGARDKLVQALALAAEQSQDAVERASLTIERGWLTLGSEPSKLLEQLSDALTNYPEHPTGLELMAEARGVAGEHEAAADQFERAAIRALGNERSAYLWARAAELWDKQIKNPARAKKALQKAAARDLDQLTVRERLEDLLTEQGDTEGLIGFTTARIAQGGEPTQRVELLRKLASLEEKRGDRTAARAALREALVVDPDSLPAWRDLARLGERASNHPERVEGLSAVVRLSRDPLELRDALLELGEVYEKHIGDSARAEAAYQRVLKLGPRNTVALDRLANLYRTTGAHESASDVLMQLSRIATEPRQKRDVTLQLVAWKEEQGDVRSAEELLEALRRAQPTDALVLRTLTALLRKTNAHVALAMHLNRAVNDLRHALVTRFDDPELWLAIVEMLVERGRLDVASQCAATASALGVHAPELEKEERSVAEREGIGGAAVSELLDDLVFPESAPAGLRILFRHAADALNRTAPLDVRTLGAEKLDKKHPLRNVIAEQARWVAHRDIEVFVSAELPYAFVPIQDAPVQLLVGRALVDNLTEDEQRFLVARALKIARAQMSVACRLNPQQLELMLHALVRAQVVSHSPPFLDFGAVEDTSRRIAKNLSRRAQSDLVPVLLELTYAGVPRFDAASVYGVASVAGSRAGLLATGNIDAALSALIKLSGMALENAGPAERVAQVDEARELVSFAISDAYFEARARAGKESR